MAYDVKKQVKETLESGESLSLDDLTTRLYPQAKEEDPTLGSHVFENQVYSALEYLEDTGEIFSGGRDGKDGYYVKTWQNTSKAIEEEERRKQKAGSLTEEARNFSGERKDVKIDFYHSLENRRILEEYAKQFGLELHLVPHFRYLFRTTEGENRAVYNEGWNEIVLAKGWNKAEEFVEGLKKLKFKKRI